MDDEPAKPRPLDYAEPERTTAKDRIWFFGGLLLGSLCFFVGLIFAVLFVAVANDLSVMYGAGDFSVLACSLSFPLLAIILLSGGFLIMRRVFFGPMPSQTS